MVRTSVVYLTLLVGCEAVSGAVLGGYEFFTGAH
jgi:hypothetical protein